MFKHKHNMTTKTITVTEEAYNAFKRLKVDDESFSDLMKRMSKRRITISELYGKGKGEIDFKQLRKNTKEIRKRIGKSMEERYARLRHFSID